MRILAILSAVIIASGAYLRGLKLSNSTEVAIIPVKVVEPVCSLFDVYNVTVY